MYTHGIEIKDDISDVKYFRESDLILTVILEVAESDDRITKNGW